MWFRVLLLSSVTLLALLDPSSARGITSGLPPHCAEQLSLFDRPNSSLSDYLKTTTPAINARLTRVLSEIRQTQGSVPDRMSESMLWTTEAGGKRLRAHLSMIFAKMLGADMEKALTIGVGVEIFQSASLMMDDLPEQDNASMRRGRRAHHLEFGASMTHNTIIALKNRAYFLISEAFRYNPAIGLDIINLWSRYLGEEGLPLGQIMDLEASGQLIMSEDELLEITYRKTGLAFAASIEPIFVLAGVTSDQLALAHIFARKLGVLYQATDDLLELDSSPEIAGKDLNRDIENETATYPKVFGIERTKKLIDQTSEELLSLMQVFPGDKKLLKELIHAIRNRQS